MKPTVVQGLTSRAVPAGQELEAINNELRPVLESVRAAANYRATYKATGNTLDSPSAWKTIWESEPLAPGSCGTIEIWVTGHDVNPFAYGARKALTYVNDGTLAGFAPVTIYERAAFMPMNSRIFLATETLQVQVMDAGAEANFVAVIDILELLL